GTDTPYLLAGYGVLRRYLMSSDVENDWLKAYGLLAQQKVNSENSFNDYTQKIIQLNQKLSEMEKELSAHQKSISTISYEKEEQERFYKTREEKEIEKVISLENQVKYIKKAQSMIPSLYDIGCYNDNLDLMLAPESDETLHHAQESRSKLRMSNISAKNVYSKEVFNKQTILLENGWMKPFRTLWNIPISLEMKNVIEQKISPTVEDLATNVDEFYQFLKEEMIKDLKYFNSLEKEIESLKSQLELQRTQFSNEIDRLSRKYYYAGHMNAIIGVYTTLDEHSELAYNYLKSLKKWDTRKALKDKIDSLIVELNRKTVETHDLRAQLQDKIIAKAEMHKNHNKMKRKSVDTNFEKPSILGKPPLQTIKIQPVVRQLTAFNFERSSFLKLRESVFAKPHHVHAPGHSRNSSKTVSKTSPRESIRSNDMVHNYYLDKLKKKAQIQKENDLDSKPSVQKNARLLNTACGRKPKPRNSYQQPRNWPPSMNSRVSNKAIYIAEPPRNSKPFLNSTNLACPICKKCIYTANHGACILQYLSEVNSRAFA
ncbi:hypothetical protein Tco_0703679, partial [Tanacetum coccineum]